MSFDIDIKLRFTAHETNDSLEKAVDFVHRLTESGTVHLYKFSIERDDC